MIRPNPYSAVPISLYLYLARAYTVFLMRRKCPDFPLVVQLQTHSYCNGRCAICPYPTASKMLSHGFMDRGLFDKIADELAAEQSPPAVIFALHNEPLLDARIFDCVRYLKSKRAETYCILPTNGELLDKFEPNRIAASGLDHLVFSLNAHSKETYDQINTGLDFEKVMGNLHAAVVNPSLKDKIEIRFALNEKNAPEIHEAREYWKKQGVRTKLAGITNRAGALAGYESFQMAGTARAGQPALRTWKRLMAGLRGTIGCDLPFFQMNILFNGDVILCCHDWRRANIVGNVAAQSLKAVWNSDKFNEIRKDISRKRYAGIDACRQCSIAG